ncbi:hypothetical protein RJ55_02733 [Drechmeria coniospora]|nr:hypothetical protein RJ55_02733 [Drechmeria coniospora]
MFQRIRGAIDRTIAEEQARQQRIDSATPSRSASTSSRTSTAAGRGRRPRRKHPVEILDSSVPNPDPAVFEAAFVIDDSDEPSRAGTPRVPSQERADKVGGAAVVPVIAINGEREQKQQVKETDRADEKTREDGDDVAVATSTETEPAPANEQSPEIANRLRKLEKLEATYPELLRSYRVAHKRATAIEPFEKALRENTPLTSIGDPNALVEYLNQMNLRSEMVMAELKKVSAEKDELMSKHDETQDRLKQVQQELDALVAEKQRAKSSAASRRSKVKAATATDPSDAKGPDDRSDAEECVESQNASSSKGSARSRLDERDKEVAMLRERLETTQAQLTDLEDQAKKQDELSKANDAKTVSMKIVDDLNTQMSVLKRENAEATTKMEELAKKLEIMPTTATGQQPPVTPASSTPAAPGASKKKNKKKKGKGGAAATATSGAQGAKGVPAAEPLASPGIVESERAALEAEIAKLKDEVREKDARIEALSVKRKTEEDLLEEIETLRDNLVDIGQDHVAAKDKIKDLEAEKLALEGQITELERMSPLVPHEVAGDDAAGDMQSLQDEYDELQDKTAALQSDLGAAQQLAQSRFRDLTELRELLQKAQPELKTLRQESAELKTVKEVLGVKVKQIMEAEKREQDLKLETCRLQQVATDRETEIINLQERLRAGGTGKQQAEESKRTAERGLRRAEADKIELSAKIEKAEREVQKMQEESSKLRPQIKELEAQLHRMKREKVAAQEEADYKSQQYLTAQGLLGSMRDQTTEISTQLKESKELAESLEEELAEVQRLLQERTREGETMRRLLADVDERADHKVREMRGRMEAAVEERERLEDESSTLARKRSRETEELKQKIRELEREVKTLGSERNDLEERQRAWRERKLELEAIESQAESEGNELRSAVAQLRLALDASESQLQDNEKQRAELRRMLGDSTQRYDRIAKDLKAAQAKLVSSSTVSGASTRTSTDSSRSGAVGGHPEMLYLKTILLQFLEQKDGRLRTQLVPVLGKLLKFDKSEEQKWTNAVQHIEVK